MQGFNPALMFRFLKKLLKGSEESLTPPPPAQPEPIAPKPTSLHTPRSAPSSPTIAPIADPIPGSAQARVSQPSPVAPTPAPVALAGPLLAIPLRALFPKLNPAVQKLASRQPQSDEVINLPLERVRSQLSSGAVKFAFSEVRQFAPPGFFTSAGQQDSLPVEIPLSEILPRISPEFLVKKPARRKVEVPDDIGPIFGPGGANLAGLRVASDNKPAGPAPSPVPKPTVPPQAVVPTPAPVSPPPAAAPTPVAPSEPIKAPRLDPSLATLQKKPAELLFNLALMDVVAHWSGGGKTELANLYRHSVEIPIADVEAGLKRGKLVYPWREFKRWIKLSPGSTLPMLDDDLQVELPLAVVAPRFLHDHGPIRKSKRVEVSSDIPDIFEVKSTTPASSPSTPSPTPASPFTAPSPGALPKVPPPPPSITPPPGPQPIAPSTPAPPKPILEFGEIFGQPDKKNWTLQEVVQKCASLKGVAGALVVTSDGLLVAGAWPGNNAAEAVAAFVPQMHNRMQQYSKELKLGECSHFTLLFENLPIQIFKSGNSFLTILGRSGESLPKVQLSAVAARLNQK